MVSEASSGHEALRELQRAQSSSNPYSIVVMDYLMGSINGLQTVQKIKGLLNPEQMPDIIILSSSDDTDTVSWCRENSACYYLMKPMKKDELKEAIIAVSSDKRRKKSDSSASGGVMQTGLNVLVAEDNEINSFLIKSMLTTKYGCTVDVAVNIS